MNDDPFHITLKVPLQNDGNTHVRPTGKIYLYDGENRRDHIGKQSIVNEDGVYLGEKIVDFLPINDEGGNVLPGTERTFEINWEGFAYNDIDSVSGKKIVSFESPGSYYSRIAENGSQMLFPWEKLAILTMNKTLQAKVEVSYKNPATNLDEVYTIELPVPVEYKYIAKTWNWGALTLILLILLLVWRLRRNNLIIHTLEEETHHLSDEISVLERARASILAKKKADPIKTKNTKSVEKTETASTKKASKATPPQQAPAKEATKKASSKTVEPEVTTSAPIKKPRKSPTKKSTSEE